MRAEVERGLDWDALIALQAHAAAAAGGWRGVRVSQLFVAPAHALSPCHYDTHHNVFAQLAGSKSFLLFAPDQVRAERPARRAARASSGPRIERPAGGWPTHCARVCPRSGGAQPRTIPTPSRRRPSRADGH